MEKPVSGNVVDEYGDVIGSVSGTYIDDYQDGSTEQIVHRSIPITVVDENGNVIGNGSLEYDDYVTFGSGGVRTIQITGSVIVQ